MTWWRKAPDVPPPKQDFLYQMVSAADRVIDGSHELLAIVDRTRAAIDKAHKGEAPPRCPKPNSP